MCDDSNRHLQDDTWPSSEHQSALEANDETMGRLTLHLAVRDVSVEMAGAEALELLKIFELRDGRPLIAGLEPMPSPKTVGWFVVDLAEVTAMSWMPESPSQPHQAVIEPVPREG